MARCPTTFEAAIYDCVVCFGGKALRMNCLFDLRYACLAHVGADAEHRQNAIKQERNFRPDRMAVIQDRNTVFGFDARQFLSDRRVVRCVIGKLARLNLIDGWCLIV